MSDVANTKRIVQPTLVFHSYALERVYLKYLFRFRIHVFEFPLRSVELFSGGKEESQVTCVNIQGLEDSTIANVERKTNDQQAQRL